jgi:hypothetical protein
MWGFTAKKGNWTIAQVLWHLADQEANLYVRLRRAVAEPGGMVSPYDQEKWADKLFYSKADPLQALGLLRLLRKANADLLKRISAKDWRKRVKHPEWGPLTLEYLVGLNIWHIEHHLPKWEGADGNGKTRAVERRARFSSLILKGPLVYKGPSLSSRPFKEHHGHGKPELEKQTPGPTPSGLGQGDR